MAPSPKRAKPGSSLCCTNCSTHTTTLGELVRSAYAKNQAMTQAGPRLHRVVRQRALWPRLRLAFFAPGVDLDAISEEPALSYHERLALPCCRNPNEPLILWSATSGHLLTTYSNAASLNKAAPP
jgi:transposase